MSGNNAIHSNRYIHSTRRLSLFDEAKLRQFFCFAHNQLGEMDKEGFEMDDVSFLIGGLNENALFRWLTTKKGIYTEGG